MAKGKYRSFSEFAEDTLDVPEWFDIEDLFGKPIIVHQAIERNGQHGRFLLVECSYVDKPDAKFGISTGGQVLLKKIDAAIEARALPITGVIIQPEGKDYYDVVGVDEISH